MPSGLRTFYWIIASPVIRERTSKEKSIRYYVLSKGDLSSMQMAGWLWMGILRVSPYPWMQCLVVCQGDYMMLGAMRQGHTGASRHGHAWSRLGLNGVARCCFGRVITKVPFRY